MKSKNKVEAITTIYAVEREEEKTVLEEEETRGFLGSVFSKIKRRFNKNECDFKEESYFTSNDDNNEDLLNEIAKDEELEDIKKNIGEDKTLKDICFLNFTSFKHSLIKLNKLSVEDYFYMLKIIIESNLNDAKDKTLFIVGLREEVLNYQDCLAIKILPVDHLQNIITFNKLPKISYNYSTEFSFDNKKAIFLLENGILLEDSDIDLEYYDIINLKEISIKYSEKYLNIFIEKKFKQTKFLTFIQIKELLDLGLNINTVDNRNKNMLWYIRDKEDLEFLIEKGININHLNDKNENFLFDHIRENNIFNIMEKELIDYIIKLNLNMNTINDKGENILFVASRVNIEYLHFLLSLKLINEKQRNLKGENILFFIEDKKTIDLLVEKLGFDIHIINNSGENLLFNRSVESVSLLIEMGVDRKKLNYKNENYFDYIKKK